MLNVRNLMPVFYDAVKATEKKIDYEKISLVFTGKYTESLFERHAAVLEKLAKIYDNGFPLTEMREISKIVHLAHEKVLCGGKEIIFPLLKLLSVSRLPFLVQNQSDYENEFLKEQVVEFTDNLLDLISLGNCEISALVSENVSGISGSEEIFNLDQSSIGQKITQILNQLKFQDPQLQFVLRIVFNIISSPLQAQKIIKCFGVESLCEKLKEESDPQNITLIVGILSKLMESNSNEETMAILLQMNHLSTIEKLFKKLVLNSKRKVEKQLRNEVAVIIHELASFSNRKKLSRQYENVFQDAGIFDDVLKFGIEPEILNLNQLHYPFMTNSIEDYEFKNLLFLILSDLIKDVNLLFAVSRGNQLSNFIFSYLTYDSPISSINQWDLRQLKGIQLVLIGLANQSMQLLTDIKGTKIDFSKNAQRKTRENSIKNPENSIKMIRFLIDSIRYESVDFEKEKFNRSSEPVGLVAAALRLILISADLDNDVKINFGSNGLIPIVLDLLRKNNQSSEIISSSLLIFSSLCKNCKANRDLLGKYDGIQTIMNFLNFTSPNTSEEKLILVSVTECILSAVCGNRVNENTFFEMDGVYYLLDMMEKKESDLRKHLLTCFLDLLENPKTRFHALEWRRKTLGKKNDGIAKFLIELWNFEEMAMLSIKTKLKFKISIVPQGEKGVLADVDRPLGEHSKKGSYNSKWSEYQGVAINEITFNIRAKIYSVFCKLGFEESKSTLSDTENVKMALISRYLDFKIGEVWEEISQELYIEIIRPVTPDQNSILESKRVINNKAKNVEDSQRIFLKTLKEKELKEENQFIKSVNYQLKSNSKDVFSR